MDWTTGSRPTFLRGRVKRATRAKYARTGENSLRRDSRRGHEFSLVLSVSHVTHCGFLEVFSSLLSWCDCLCTFARDFNLSCSQLLAAFRFAAKKQHSPAINLSQARYFRLNSDNYTRGFTILN